jgi:hypothetical protein
VDKGEFQWFFTDGNGSASALMWAVTSVLSKSILMPHIFRPPLIVKKPPPKTREQQHLVFVLLFI